MQIRYQLMIKIKTTNNKMLGIRTNVLTLNLLNDFIIFPILNREHFKLVINLLNLLNEM